MKIAQMLIVGSMSLLVASCYSKPSYTYSTQMSGGISIVDTARKCGGLSLPQCQNPYTDDERPVVSGSD